MRDNLLRSREKQNNTGESRDLDWKESDLFTAKGCCYALATILLKNKEDDFNSN